MNVRLEPRCRTQLVKDIVELYYTLYYIYLQSLISYTHMKALPQNIVGIWFDLTESKTEKAFHLNIIKTTQKLFPDSNMWCP